MTIKEMRNEIKRIWKELQKDNDAYIQVNRAFDESEYVETYHRCYLQGSAKKQQVELYLTSLINAVYDTRNENKIFQKK